MESIEDCLNMDETYEQCVQVEIGVKFNIIRINFV